MLRDIQPALKQTLKRLSGDLMQGCEWEFLSVQPLVILLESKCKGMPSVNWVPQYLTPLYPAPTRHLFSFWQQDQK